MSAPLIWLHPEALRRSHPVFRAAPTGTRAVFVWDDEDLRAADYSLKRLIFIYETLCELQVEVIRGETLAVISTLAPSTLYVPETHNPRLLALVQDLATRMPLETVPEEPFALLHKAGDVRRFFQYWKKAEKTAFQANAGLSE